MLPAGFKATAVSPLSPTTGPVRLSAQRPTETARGDLHHSPAERSARQWVSLKAPEARRVPCTRLTCSVRLGPPARPPHLSTTHAACPAGPSRVQVCLGPLLSTCRAPQPPPRGPQLLLCPRVPPIRGHRAARVHAEDPGPAPLPLAAGKDGHLHTGQRPCDRGQTVLPITQDPRRSWGCTRGSGPHGQRTPAGSHPQSGLRSPGRVCVSPAWAGRARAGSRVVSAARARTP